MSVTAWTLTPIWQFATLPNVPQYCLATPGERVDRPLAWRDDSSLMDSVAGPGRLTVAGHPGPLRVLGSGVRVVPPLAA